ncbi:MAG: 50S ribosomal protein L24 [Parachlamydiales bacterium]|nr:50S ribosomal protein L24 [Parachlamydiales bacterium]
MSQVKDGKRLREGDKVIAIAGNDKGKTGTLLGRVGDKVIIEGLNVRKKQVKKTQDNPQGGMISREMPIHASNVAFCGESDKPVRLKARVNAAGEREFYYTDGGREVIHRTLKKSK